MRRAALGAWVGLVGLGIVAPRAARAEPPPCKGCVLVAPRTDLGPQPLLVTLHGDIDHADTTAAPWRSAIVARGWGLLSIECPVAEGCERGSFWRWNGPVSWLLAQVAKVADAYPVDRARMFVSGWSGGASYIGWHAQDFSRAFAGIVVHGGGVKPRLSSCAERAPPVYFLVGSANPLHDMAKDLRAYFERCHHEVVWDLLPRKGHPEELAALDRARADTILTQLETWTRPAPAAASSAPAPDPSSAPSGAPSAASPASSAAPLVSAPSPKSARGCSIAPGRDLGGTGLVLVAVASLARACRPGRARRGRSPA